MAEFPALPLWTDAYLADCHHLTDEEHGRYLLMLIEMWRSPKCALPDDDEWLARKFRKTVDQVRSDLRPLILQFFKKERGFLYQKRLRKERERVLLKKEKNKNSAKSRWHKEKDPCERICESDATTSPSGIAFAMLPDPDPDPDNKTPISLSGDAPPQQKIIRTSEGSRLADQPFPEPWRQFALTEGLPDPEREWAKFTDYWRGQSGAKGRKADWEATWRNWVRRSIDDDKNHQNQRSNRREPKLSGHETLFAAGLAVAAEFDGIRRFDGPMDPANPAPD